MAIGWVTSLQCKSRAPDDVVSNHQRRRRRRRRQSNFCSVRGIRDVVETGKPEKKRPAAAEASLGPHPTIITRFAGSLLPSLAELPEGHPSRNVVEIIFQSGWGEDGGFSGRIELVFKVQNSVRMVARFEEYREVVRARGRRRRGEGDARCAADGNEVMRFYCLGGAGGGAWGSQSGKGAGVCTFSGSGVAHEMAGGGRGRRAMLVCRVIAGRVGLSGLGDGYDSVTQESGELFVFDTRALLPCFLIIYNKL